MGWIAIVPGRDKKAIKELKAVEKTVSQEKLAKYCRKTQYWDVYRKAVAKITDQDLLADLVINSRDGDSGIAALQNIQDQNKLFEIAGKVKPGYLRMEVVNKLIDADLAQKLYTEIAKDETESFPIRIQAIDKLQDQALCQWVYTDIAKNIKRHSFNGTDEVDAAVKAIKHLTDLDVLADVMENSRPDTMIRFAAEKRIDELKR